VTPLTAVQALRPAQKRAPPVAAGLKWPAGGEGAGLGEETIENLVDEQSLDLLALWMDRLPLRKGGIRHRC
jgi:hypothetical protein